MRERRGGTRTARSTAAGAGGRFVNPAPAHLESRDRRTADRLSWSACPACSPTSCPASRTATHCRRSSCPDTSDLPLASGAATRPRSSLRTSSGLGDAGPRRQGWVTRSFRAVAGSSAADFGAERGLVALSAFPASRT
jgi:hypothetical protein